MSQQWSFPEHWQQRTPLFLSVRSQ